MKVLRPYFAFTETKNAFMRSVFSGYIEGSECLSASYITAQEPHLGMMMSLSGICCLQLALARCVQRVSYG